VYGVALEELMERQRETHPTLQVPLLVARALEVLHKQNGLSPRASEPTRHPIDGWMVD
jgi:hypothetical protein